MMRRVARRVEDGGSQGTGETQLRENHYRECALQWAQAIRVIYFERLKAEYRTLPLETPSGTLERFHSLLDITGRLEWHAET